LMISSRAAMVVTPGMDISRGDGKGVGPRPEPDLKDRWSGWDACQHGMTDPCALHLVTQVSGPVGACVQ